ncbi:minor tail protein [Mycobacterium phage DrLupo]|uniref:Minor tail protein n=1 Tax=Mycobacterium phage DrLupo TaxID=2499037 RepID=A0A3S9UQM1_9CAUD|nr:minor tail protein [Mycobacterium phage DrLupo]AZS12572.1 minor tail protein [Mycobacterium phage DrLupo]
MIRNLVAGQYQFGDLVFGRGTTVNVESFDEKPYDVNVQDLQLSRNDEMYPGQDQLKPTTIELTFHVRYNWLLPHHEGAIPNFWAEMPTVEDFAREWKSDEIRKIPGAVKPLYVCGRDGQTRMIFGRAGQFTAAENADYTEAIECMAEFRRLDTFAYDIIENAVVISQGQLSRTVAGTGGNAPSWFRLLLFGPINHPVFTIDNAYNQPGPITVDFNYNVAPGEVVEICGYPWQRRVVNNANPPLTLARQLIGGSPYLDRLRFDHRADLTVTMAATGLTADSQAQIRWHDAYQRAK